MKYALLIIQLCTGMYCCAQLKPFVEEFGIEQGLSQSVVYDLHFDRKGFLWVATHDGLNMYDGYEFKKKYHHPKQQNSLGNNTVHTMQEDADGLLWITTLNYLHCLNPASGIIKRYPLPANDAALTKKNVSLTKAKPVYIQVFTTQFKGVFNKTEQVFSRLPVHDSVLWQKPRPDMPGSTQMYFAVNKHERNYILYSFAGNEPVVQTTAFEQVLGKDKEILQILEPEPGTTWFVTGTKELVIQNGNNVTRCKLPGNEKISGNLLVTAFSKDKHGNFYIALQKALYYFNTSTTVFTEVKKTNNHPSFSETFITDIVTDDAGNVWVGTFGNGLFRFNSESQRFYSLSNIPGTDNTLSEKFVKGVYVNADGSLLVSFNSVTDINHISPNWQSIRLYKRADFYNKKEHYGKLFNMNPQLLSHAAALQHFVNAKELLTASNPVLFADPTNQLWKRTATSIIHINTGRVIETGTYIQSSCTSLDNKIWLGTAGKGLMNVDTKSGVQEVYNSENMNGITDNTVNCLLYDSSSNRLFIGTNFGLSIFSCSAKAFFNYGTEQGLAHKNIYSMLFDDQGRLWLGTGNGLSVFDTADKQFTNYNKSDGLLNNEYNRDCAVKKPNGELVFGGTNGIDYFIPAATNPVQRIPNIEITGLYVFNRQVSFTSSPVFAYNENNLLISFSAMHFTNPGRNRYRYRLKGTDQQWNLLEGKGSVTYPSLAPGKYVFEVQSAIVQQGKEGPVTSLSFTIRPPWWKTYWFYLAFISLLAGSAWLLYRFRQRKKTEIIQVRSRINRDLHDDVGATLSTVKAYTDLLREHPTKQEYLDQISSNAGEMLERLELIVWANNPQHDQFYNLLEKIKLFAQPLFHHQGIELDINVQGELENLYLPGAVRQHLFLLIKEACNNIIRHAQADYCQLKFTKQKHQLLITVADNGKGINVQTKQPGNGLKNMEARIKELYGTFDVHGNEGTQLHITIPYPFKIRSKNYA